MKLRIRGNSVRLRVTRTELEQMGSRGKVTDRIAFPGNSALEYVLKADPAIDAPKASFADGAVTVRVPAAVAERWVRRDDMVSIHGSQGIGDDDTLSILVEKDFACLKPREGEDDSDMFAHPEPDSANC